MAIYLGPVQSLRHWRAAPSDYTIRHRSPRSVELPKSVEEWGGVCGLADVLDVDARAVDVLVGSADARSNPKWKRSEENWVEITYRAHELEFAPGSFCRIRSDVYLCSPELCILLMARNLDELEVVQLMYELCGSYSIADSVEGFTRRQPLTSIKRIRRYIEKMIEMRGARTLLKLSDYVLDGSASPMETACAMALLLPRRLGGYALKCRPTLNERISVPAHARKVIPKHHLVADLAWMDKSLVAEYDSSAEHEGASRIDADNNRRVGLGYLGYEVVTITRSRMRSPAEFDKVFLPIARHLGLRVRKPTGTVLKKRRALLWKLRRPIGF